MVIKKSWNIHPQTLYVLIMIGQFTLLISVLKPLENHPMIFLLFIFTAFSMTLRWRIKMKPIYMLIDASIILLISWFYPLGYFCIIIFAYYFAYQNKWLYLIPFIIIGFLYQDRTFGVLFIQAVVLGTLLYHWSNDLASCKEMEDHLRRQIYELESVQTHLLADYQDTEKISRLTERRRIAEILHDSLGHELTAAHLSMKAYKTLLANNKLEQAHTTLERVEEKISSSLEQLKDSVKSIEPTLDLDLHNLTSLLENYLYPIEFVHQGDVSKLKPYIWQLMMISTKEALTNITKHASPKRIHVSLDVSDYITRLVIENDGVKVDTGKMSGNGLRYIRRRLEAINGSLSVQKKDTYKLIIIIPIENER